MSKKMKIATLICASTLFVSTLAPIVNGEVIDEKNYQNNSDYYNPETSVADESFVTFVESLDLAGTVQIAPRANVPVDGGGSSYTLQSQFNGDSSKTDKIKEFNTRLVTSFGVLKLSKYAITVWNAAFSTVYVKPKTEYYTTKIYTKTSGGKKYVKTVLFTYSDSKRAKLKTTREHIIWFYI
ncbi:hypothetical protein HCC18_00145 [Listeria booriae]|uniref:hypothetical protein n=1 Tax=Listeria booriae TaxID=1552123 RepID=UPI001628A4F2|nr:hypothetical protein [Listeria booriae]MBC2315238.1 hypothetical protein [Listeria booriae]